MPVLRPEDLPKGGWVCLSAHPEGWCLRSNSVAKGTHCAFAPLLLGAGRGFHPSWAQLAGSGRQLIRVPSPGCAGVRKEVRAEGKTVLLFWYRNQIYAIEARWGRVWRLAPLQATSLGDGAPSITQPAMQHAAPTWQYSSQRTWRQRC